MEEELFKKIKKDLEKSGFGSELKALNIFEKYDYHTLAGHNYFDKDEEKLREIDILAMHNITTRFRDIEYDYFIFNNNYITAEVKKSEKPWVVFKSLNQDTEILRNFINVNNEMIFNNGNDTVLYREIEEELSLLTENWKLKINGIHESFKSPNNPSRWYGACISSIKAIIQVIESNEEFIKSNDKYSNKYFEYQPLLILDGKLVCAEMGNNFDISLEEVGFAKIEISLKSKSYDSKIYTIDMVTLDNLENYLEMKKNKQELINDAIIKIENFDTKKIKTWVD